LQEHRLTADLSLALVDGDFDFIAAEVVTVVGDVDFLRLDFRLAVDHIVDGADFGITLTVTHV
jgi:hypothetical protein